MPAHRNTRRSGASKRRSSDEFERHAEAPQVQAAAQAPGDVSPAWGTDACKRFKSTAPARAQPQSAAARMRNPDHQCRFVSMPALHYVSHCDPAGGNSIGAGAAVVRSRRLNDRTSSERVDAHLDQHADGVSPSPQCLHMFDGAILGAQAGSIAIEFFAARQALKDIADNGRIHVNSAMCRPTIFFRRVAEQFQLRLIGAQDYSGVICALCAAGAWGACRCHRNEQAARGPTRATTSPAVRLTAAKGKALGMRPPRRAPPSEPTLVTTPGARRRGRRGHAAGDLDAMGLGRRSIQARITSRNLGTARPQVARGALSAASLCRLGCIFPIAKGPFLSVCRSSTDPFALAVWRCR